MQHSKRLESVGSAPKYNPTVDNPILYSSLVNDLLSRKSFVSVILHPTCKMTINVVPTAPRAMVQQEGIDSAALSSDQIFQNATRNMYPKLVLFEALAGFKDDYNPRGRSSDDICEDRRDFLDSFAYLCDVEKGGATVTAAALQRLPYSNILWLAANEGIRRDVEVYAKSILQMLKVVESGNQVKVQDDILRLAVQNCHSRLNYYKGIMQKYARNCRMQLRQETGDDIGAVRLFLFEYQC